MSPASMSPRARSAARLRRATILASSLLVAACGAEPRPLAPSAVAPVSPRIQINARDASAGDLALLDDAIVSRLRFDASARTPTIEVHTTPGQAVGEEGVVLLNGAPATLEQLDQLQPSAIVHAELELAGGHRVLRLTTAGQGARAP